MIVGDGYFGKIDHVPGVFSVQTRFLHCMWTPLVPRESYLIADDDSHPPIRIPLRWKSVWIAWIRSCLMLMGLWLVATGVAVLAVHGTATLPIVIIVWVIALLLFGLWVWSHRLSRAGIDRALQLGQLLGVSPDEIKMLFDSSIPQPVPSQHSTESPGRPVLEPPSLSEIAADVNEGLKHKVVASKDAAQDAATSYFFLGITLVVLLPIACVGLVTGIGVRMALSQIAGDSVVVVSGTVITLGLLIPAICVRISQKLLTQPLYFGESRGFWIVLISLSWVVGVICSAL